jgi:hypothetical protein
MAERKEKPELVEDPLVSKVVHDPSSPKAKLLSGYLGRSSRRGHWRVYLTLDFSEYVELAAKDILHTQALGSPNASGSWIWVRDDAKMEHVKPDAESTGAEFLKGPIASKYIGNSLFGNLGRVGVGGGFGLIKTFSVTECATCPTDDGAHTCVPAVCTLATSCLTSVPTDPGCGDKFL